MISITADKLKYGQKATIVNVDDNDICCCKLMEMNCLPGEIIILERSAPLGDPLVFNIGGYSLSLRKQEARQIIVKAN